VRGLLGGDDTRPHARPVALTEVLAMIGALRDQEDAHEVAPFVDQRCLDVEPVGVMSAVLRRTPDPLQLPVAEGDDPRPKVVREEDEALERIRTMFDAEMDAPTDPGTTSAIS